ncbi:hypothetical protein [Acetobacter sp. UBA5411]|uniref:AbiTii domain-containing protein n=1 Tax=Acetobacter sp. UBA5411 TaxID=1945905 RepID=UPI0025BEB1A0|nr:hypothetical protein [Acetobacter sp. UBA5411]
MPLIESLLQKAMDDSCSVRSLLFSAKIVASKLKQSESLSWIDNELNGYKLDNTETGGLPPYRLLSHRPQFLNPIRGWCAISIQRMARYLHDENIFKTEDLLRNEGSLAIYMNNAFSDEICEELGFQTQVRLLLERSDFQAVLDTVRHKILDWALKLDSEGITGECMNFPAEQIQRASQMTINIHNTGNMAGLGFGNNHTTTTTQSVGNSVDMGKAKDLLAQIEPSLGNMSLSPENLVQAQNA